MKVGIARCAALALWLAGCGGEVPLPPAVDDTALTGTLAYVRTDCREGPGGLRGHQHLEIRRGEGAPIVAKELDTLSALRVSGICQAFAVGRFGFGSVAGGAFQRLGVSPDGSTVVFEVTDEFTMLPIVLPPEDIGIFVVRADGTGLRRVGPPSREPSFAFFANYLTSIRNTDPYFAFSPDGKLVVYSDIGPGTGGEETAQIFSLDLATGTRTQLTHLPGGPSPIGFPAAPGTCCARFLDGDTVAFASTANLDGRNGAGLVTIYTVKRDGTGLSALPSPAAPGVAVLPAFGLVSSPELEATLYVVLGQPANTFPRGAPTFPGFMEVFLRGPDRVRQLTDFRRVDTLGPLLSRDRRRVYFVASADPFGMNPTETCQVFSRDIAAGGLRQLTSFRDAERSQNGCIFNPTMGCSSLYLFEDALSGAIVFYSSCDPLGTNPMGGQIFAMAPDGAGLRQITDMRGLSWREGEELLVELPGPFVYAGGA